MAQGGAGAQPTFSELNLVSTKKVPMKIKVLLPFHSLLVCPEQSIFYSSTFGTKYREGPIYLS